MQNADTRQTCDRRRHSRHHRDLPSPCVARAGDRSKSIRPTRPKCRAGMPRSSNWACRTLPRKAMAASRDMPTPRFIVRAPLIATPSRTRFTSMPECAGQGVGSALMPALIAGCARAGRRQIIAVIGDSANLASIRLHAKFGFKRVGLLPAVGFKFGRWVDSVLMQREIGDEPATLLSLRRVFETDFFAPVLALEQERLQAREKSARRPRQTSRSRSAGRKIYRNCRPTSRATGAPTVRASATGSGRARSGAGSKPVLRST